MDNNSSRKALDLRRHDDADARTDAAAPLWYGMPDVYGVSTSAHECLDCQRQRQCERDQPQRPRPSQRPASALSSGLEVGHEGVTRPVRLALRQERVRYGNSPEEGFLLSGRRPESK